MRHKLLMTRALAITALGTLAAMPAAVSANEDSPAVRRACSGDAHRLCPKTKMGTPEMRYCMEAKQSYLSRGCGRALEDAGVAPRGYFTGKR